MEASDNISHTPKPVTKETMKISQKSYTELIEKDMAVVNKHVPDGLEKDHINLVLATSIDTYYPQKTEAKPKDIPDSLMNAASEYASQWFKNDQHDHEEHYTAGQHFISGAQWQTQNQRISNEKTVEQLTDEYCSHMGYIQTGFVRNIFEYAFNLGQSQPKPVDEKVKESVQSIWAVSCIDAKDLGTSIVRTYQTSAEANSELIKMETGQHEMYFSPGLLQVYEISLPANWQSQHTDLKELQEENKRLKAAILKIRETLDGVMNEYAFEAYVIADTALNY